MGRLLGEIRTKSELMEGSSQIGFPTHFCIDICIKDMSFHYKKNDNQFSFDYYKAMSFTYEDISSDYNIRIFHVLLRILPLTMRKCPVVIRRFPVIIRRLL